MSDCARKGKRAENIQWFLQKVQVWKTEVLDPTEGTATEGRGAGPKPCTCEEMGNFIIMLCRQGLNLIYSTRAEKPCLVNSGDLSD